jgi:NAD(P)-dependent dehydrogenase (short-subunit alcohol dehydrogenase family)
MTAHQELSIPPTISIDYVQGLRCTQHRTSCPSAGPRARPSGITANVINPGATDTGWMSQAQMREFAGHVPLGRVSTPDDCAHLARFLCSREGGWINGQLIHSNGGAQ